MPIKKFAQVTVNTARICTQPTLMAMLAGLVLWTWAGSIFLYVFERAGNDGIKSYVDAFLLSADIVTSAGFSDAHPISPVGKAAGLCLMFTGTVLFWSYVAVFASEVCKVFVDKD